MPMYNPCHPGAILREDVFRPLHMTITAAAKHLGVSRKTLSKVINERGAITPEMAIRLEKAFKPSADHWLAMQAAYDLWQARQHSNDIHVTPIELDAA